MLIALPILLGACGTTRSLQPPTNSEIEVMREPEELPGYDGTAEWFHPEAPPEILDNVSVLVETPATEEETELPDISDDLAERTKALLPSIEELFDYPVVINRRVLTWIDQYTGNSKNSFEHSLQRSGRYLPMAREIFAEEGVPRDLAFLAHIESGFRTNARSNKRALGLWQFLLGTAKDYNLRCDAYVDERMDPELSTRAAARFLKDLHRRYDDWLLALAAYNAGPGNVDKAIREAGSKNFWDIARTRHLMTETQNFVPAILAATILAKSPGAYGLTEEVDPAFVAEAVVVDAPVRLSLVAQITGLTMKELRGYYNPSLLQESTPPARSGYPLRLPVGYATPTGRALAQLPSGEKLLYSIHTVSTGETLGQIARNYGMTVRQLQMANRLGNSIALTVGQELEIPSFDTADLGQDMAPTLLGSPSNGVHVVTSGESLYKIAKIYGVTIGQIQHANRIADPRRIHPGQTLEIPGSNHVVTNLASLPTIVPDPVRASGDVDTAAEMGRVESTAHLVDQFRDEIEGGPSRATRGTSPPATADVRDTDLDSDNWRLRDGASSTAGTEGGRAVESSSSASASYVVPEVHLVESGETLSEIGRRYLISVAELRAWNGMGRSSLIKPGQRILLNSDRMAEMESKEQDKGQPSFHIVAKGETLWRIARNYGIKVADLMQWNRLRSKTRIYPGQQLKIF